MGKKSLSIGLKCQIFVKQQEPLADKADGFRLPPSPSKRKIYISVLSVPCGEIKLPIGFQ